jgi:hypothetical protein
MELIGKSLKDQKKSSLGLHERVPGSGSCGVGRLCCYHWYPSPKIRLNSDAHPDPSLASAPAHPSLTTTAQRHASSPLLSPIAYEMQMLKETQTT